MDYNTIIDRRMTQAHNHAKALLQVVKYTLDGSKLDVKINRVRMDVFPKEDETVTLAFWNCSVNCWLIYNDNIICSFDLPKSQILEDVLSKVKVIIQDELTHTTEGKVKKDLKNAIDSINDYILKIDLSAN